MQHPAFIESAAEGFELEAQQQLASRQPAAGGESSGTPPKPDHGALRTGKKFAKSPSLNNTATPFVPKNHLAHTASHSEKLNAVHLMPVHHNQQPQIVYQTPVYYQGPAGGRAVGPAQGYTVVSGQYYQQPQFAQPLGPQGSTQGNRGFHKAWSY